MQILLEDPGRPARTVADTIAPQRSGARLARGAVVRDRAKSNSADRGGLLAAALDGVVTDLDDILGNVLRAAAGGALDVEQVADALECPDPAGLAGLRTQLAADATDPDPQVLEVVAVFRSPDLGQELGVEDDLAGMRGEVLKEQPLGPRQLLPPPC